MTDTASLNDLQLLAAAEKLIMNLEFRYNWIFLETADLGKKLDFLTALQWYSVEGAKNYGIRQQKNSSKASIFYKELTRSFAVKLKKIIADYSNEKKFDKKLEKKLRFQLIYQIDGETHEIKKDKNGLQFDDQTFFYTILLNYSLHSMNSKNLGAWIFKLFHKNDGYQTPNVINPYREEGIINVNSELALSTDRLVYNIIDQYRRGSKAVILNKYGFKRFILRLKDKRTYNLKELNVTYSDKEKFLEFLSRLPESMDFNIGHNGIGDLCIVYLIKKFQKIASIYIDHFYEPQNLEQTPFSEQIEKNREWKLAKTKEFLLSSDSHVARKFNQTYNFLVSIEQLGSELEFINSWNLFDDIRINEEELTRWIEFSVNKFALEAKGTHELINHLFPAIFDIDIEFEKKDGSRIKLSDLSSGEQQYIFNINTVTYHINNLKTIKPIEGTKIRNYNYINIVLDEIELYYHPEYQKNLIKDLRREIKKIDSLGDLKSFNIMFLTHSPFILSDIPNENILRLEDGFPSLRNFDPTFGANIHDLLANDFFLKGFMGEFAKSYITKLIRKIEKTQTAQLSKKKYNAYLDKINLIGEAVIRNSLKSLLDKKFKDYIDWERRLEEVDKEREFINKNLKNNGTT
ncbi:AAA family ATPase [Flavobacterium ginsengiterrae]|uniref:AAA family ATPase n=2 Tax=Flavobacteriaceae TaxID=49546 RepID=A0ABP7GS25_9FLAO